MSLAVIKDNHITVFGTKYFVANAQTLSIGSYGEKATPVLGQNKLEVKDHLPAPTLQGKIRTLPPIDIDTAQSTKANFSEAVSASLKAIGFSGSRDLIYEALAKKQLKLVQLFVEENDVKEAVNGAPKALNNLKSYGGDARVVNSLCVVVEASLANSFTAGAKFEVTADALGIFSIKASGGATVSGKDKITLAPGTGLAYLLLDLNWNKDKTKVEKTKVDEWSLN